MKTYVLRIAEAIQAKLLDLPSDELVSLLGAEKEVVIVLALGHACPSLITPTRHGA